MRLFDLNAELRLVVRVRHGHEIDERLDDSSDAKDAARALFGGASQVGAQVIDIEQRRNDTVADACEHRRVAFDGCDLDLTEPLAELLAIPQVDVVAGGGFDRVGSESAGCDDDAAVGADIGDDLDQLHDAVFVDRTLIRLRLDQDARAV